MESQVEDEKERLNTKSDTNYETTIQREKLERQMSYSIRMPRHTWIVEPLIAALFFCIIGVSPLVEQYVYSRVAEDYPILSNNTDNQTVSDVCRSINSTEDEAYNATQEVQASTAQFMMFFTITAAVPSLLSTLIVGGYSDTLYRKPALIMPTLGTALRLAIVVAVVILKLNVYYIFIAAFVDGCFGSTGSVVMGCFSYMADILQPESRAFRMVILDVLIVLAGAGAESLLGFLIRHYGYVIPSLCLLGVAAIALLYVIFLVPETHIPLPDAAFSLRESLTATYRVYKKAGPRRFSLWLILVILILPEIPIISSQSIATLFQMNQPLCWGPALIGVYLAAALFIIQAGSFLGSMVFIKCLKMPNIVVVMIGDLSGVAGYTFFSMCVKTWQVFVVPVIGMFQLLPLPMCRAIGSNLVDTSEQGALFSGMAILYTVASIGGSLTFNILYTKTLPFFHGTVFLLCAAMYLMSFILAGFYFVHDRRTKYRRLRPLPSLTSEEQ